MLCDIQSISILALVHFLSLLLNVSNLLMLLRLGGMEVHMTADLTRNDFLAMADSTIGTRNVPSSALLVTESYILELM